MLNIRVKVKKSVKKSEKELKYRIFSVYDQCATNVEPLPKARKQFFTTFKRRCNKRTKTDQDRV